MRIMLDTNILVSAIFFPSRQMQQFLFEVCSHYNGTLVKTKIR